MIYIKEQETIKCPGITSAFISFEYNLSLVEIVKSIDCHIYHKELNSWEIPIAYLSDFIDKTLPIDGITVEFLDETIQQNGNIEISNDYKIPLFQHQIDGIVYGLSHNKFLLLDDPGLGKTATIIHLAEELYKAGKIEHCLVLCGVNTLKTNWKNEIAKHSDLDSLILGERINTKGKLVVDGIPKRVYDLSHPIKQFFVITNIETIRDNNIVKKILQNKPNKFDMIVVDEIHVCKSTSTQTGRNLLKLKAPYMIGATGTAIINNPIDAYAPMKWIGAEKANLSTFKRLYCEYGNFNAIVGYKNLTSLKNQLNHISIRRQKDLLNLPEKTIITEYVDMNDNQQQFYNDIVDGILTEVDLVNINTSVLLSVILRLRQATACPSILTSSPIKSSKILRAEELTDEILSNKDFKVVIFSTFKETANLLHKEMMKYNPVLCTGDVNDSIIAENIQKFQNDDDCRLFIGTWQKCGTGITLTSASYMIFIDTPWTYASFEQACDRIHRIGSKNSVFIYELIAKDTIDERVHELVVDKEAISGYIVDDKVSEKSIETLRKYIQSL